MSCCTRTGTMRRSAMAIALSMTMLVAPAIAQADQPPAPCHPNPLANLDMAIVRNRGDIRDFQERIGRGLGPNKLRLRCHRSLNRIEFRHVDEAHFQSPAHVNFAQQFGHAVINIRRRDDMIARRERLQNCARRGETRGKGERLVTAFERSQRLFERLPVRVRAPAVNEAVRITAFRVAFERGGKMDRRRHRAGCGVDLMPGVYRQRFDAHFAICFHRVLFLPYRPRSVEAKKERRLSAAATARDKYLTTPPRERK